MMDVAKRLETLKKLLDAKSDRSATNVPPPPSGEQAPAVVQPPEEPRSNMDILLDAVDYPDTVTAEQKGRIVKYEYLRRRDRALTAPRKPGSSWGWI